MTVTTSKITDTVAGGLGAAREAFDTRFVPVAIPAGRRVAKQASKKAAKQLHQARGVVQERLVPKASAAIGTAMVASAPARAEALRRGKRAAAALRGADSIEIKARRRWPIAILALAFGALVGAAAAWLAQVAKPVQLTPYPLRTEQGEEGEQRSVDLKSQESAESHEGL